MKKFFAVILAMALLLSAVPVCAAATVTDSGSFGADGGNLSWTMTLDGTLTVSGSGGMGQGDAWDWQSYNSRILSVKVQNGVTTVGNSAFAECWSLTDAALPDSLTSIGRAAFGDCRSLKKIAVPEGVTEIGSGAFADCIALTGVTLPGGLTSLEPRVFAGCEALKSVTIPEGVTEIGESAFSGCESMTSVTVPQAVKTIGKKALGYYYSRRENDDVQVKGFTIKGYTGTAAEKYAAENGFKFVSLGEKLTPYRPGDVTGDGRITSADALQIQRYVVKRSSVLDNAEKKVRDAADVTGEGDITSADALQIQRYVVQRPSVLDGK